MGQFPLGRNHRHDMTIYCPANRLDAGDGASTLTYVVVTRGQALSRELYVYQLFQPSHHGINTLCWGWTGKQRHRAVKGGV